MADNIHSNLQRWSRGHKARVQGHKKNPRPRPRTQKKSEAKAKDTKKIRGQGQPFRGQTLSRPRTGMLEAKGALQKKKRKRSPQKNVFQKIFQALNEILTIQKIVLSSSRGQANFQRLEASRSRPRT